MGRSEPHQGGRHEITYPRGEARQLPQLGLFDLDRPPVVPSFRVVAVPSCDGTQRLAREPHSRSMDSPRRKPHEGIS